MDGCAALLPLLRCRRCCRCCTADAAALPTTAALQATLLYLASSQSTAWREDMLTAAVTCEDAQRDVMLMSLVTLHCRRVWNSGAGALLPQPFHPQVSGQSGAEQTFVPWAALPPSLLPCQLLCCSSRTAHGLLPRPAAACRPMSS